KSKRGASTTTPRARTAGSPVVPPVPLRRNARALPLQPTRNPRSSNGGKVIFRHSVLRANDPGSLAAEATEPSRPGPTYLILQCPGRDGHEVSSRSVETDVRRRPSGLTRDRKSVV